MKKIEPINSEEGIKQRDRAREAISNSIKLGTCGCIPSMNLFCPYHFNLMREAGIIKEILPSTSETKMRSFVKSATWRVIAVLSTLVITYAFTRSIASSLGITAVGAITSTIEYYFHERIWNSVGWGKQ